MRACTLLQSKFFYGVAAVSPGRPQAAVAGARAPTAVVRLAAKAGIRVALGAGHVGTTNDAQATDVAMNRWVHVELLP
jgi:hypothetical protein